MRYLMLVLCCVGFAGCGATATKIYDYSGKEAYSIDCSGVANAALTGSDLTWTDCLNKAGEICQDKGYDLLNYSGESSPVGFAYQGGGSNASVYGNQAAYSGSSSSGYQGVAFSGNRKTRSMQIRCKD